MNYIIRKMAAEDLEQVVEIDGLSFSLPWPAHTFHYEVSRNSAARCWVAEQDGKIIAMLVGWFIVDEIHIATFAVHPDFRQRGIGRHLLLHALQFSQAEGARQSFLEARASNAAALKLYEEVGYVQTGLRKKYYSDNGEDAVLMTLKMGEG
ncbi:MAG: ribosomal protein S18-alanine N-acetyltransferase [Anaerolineales bacterium]